MMFLKRTSGSQSKFAVPFFIIAAVLMLALRYGRIPAAAQTSVGLANSNAAVAQSKSGKAAAKRTSEMPGAVPGATYVGSDICKTCHDDLYSKHFEGTPHFALLKAGEHGCEDCHGPGSAHVEAAGDVSKIIRFSRLSPEQSSKRCLQCHATSLENMNFSRSVHLRNGVGCLECHSPHHATEANHLLKSEQTLLCYGCHSTQKAEFSRPYRHRVDVGLIQCSDCHNPHGTFVERQLRTAAGEFPICTNCHTETMGPFAFEHVPVKQEGCTACHTPHGSSNPRLLRVSQVNLLCMQCHTPTAGRNVPPIPTFHAQNSKYQACTMCHTQIHGSNFDEFFFR